MSSYMDLEMKRLTILGAALAILSGSALAQRVPTATYTATGTAGAWDLEFTLTNNFLPGEGDLYFFGVLLDSGRQVLSTPAGWDSERFRTWSNQSYGGSDTMYNNIWLNLYSRPDDILPSQSKSGFVARSNSLEPPKTLQFFSFAAAGVYQGHSNYSNYWNPGFEGTATYVSSPVPEPSSLAILGIGFFALLRRRK